MPNTSAVVVINGMPFGGWTNVSVTQSFDKATGDCSLRMSPLPGVPLPIRLGDRAQVILAGRPVITGHVHRLWGQHELTSHSIQATVRDKTQDLVDNTIGPKLEIDPPVTMKQVAERTISTLGLKGIGVIDRVNPRSFEAAEKVSGAIDDKGHAFLENWANRRNCVLTTDGLGNLVIDQNRDEMMRGAKIHFGLPDDPLNNVIKSQFSIDDFNRANTYAVAGQKSPNSKDYWEGKAKGDPDGQSDKMANRYGIAHDQGVRKERKQHVRGGRGHHGKSARESAKWRANTARAKSNEYVCTVAGYTAQNGELWWPGKKVPVYDYWWDIDALLFLTEVIFTKSGGDKGGATTQLKFSIGDAYKPQAGRNKSESRTGSRFIGDDDDDNEAATPSDMGIDPDQAEIDEEPPE